MDGARVEEEAEHAACAVEGEGESGGGDGVAGGGLEGGAEGFEMGPGVPGFEFAELGDACGHGEGVSGEGAGLVDGAVGCEEVHDIGAPAEGPDGESAADDFSECGEVRGDACEFLDAAFGDAEAGHDLVEDEKGTVFGGEGAEEFEEARFGKVEAGVGGEGFHDDGGDFGAGGLEEGSEGGGVVEGEGGGEGGEVCGDACAVRFPVGEGAAACGDEEGIDVAVIAAFEFDDAVAACEAAGEADGGHGGLGAAVDHADFLDGGDPGGDDLSHFDFERVGDTKGDAAFGGGLDGVDDGLGGMAEDGGAPGADVVDEVVAIDIPDVGAFGFGDEERVAIDVSESADRGVDAAWDEGFGGSEELGGAEVGVHGSR